MTTSPWFAPDAETTGRYPAVPYGGDPKLAAALHPAESSSPALTPDPGATVAQLEAWRTEHLSEDAAVLHSLACACLYGGDVEGHGVDFEQLAATFVARAVARVVSPRYPVEAKVWAGTWGALGATVALALVTLLLDQLGVLGATFGGAPWAGVVLAVLGVVLPPVAAFIRGYLAEHTARP